MRRIIGSCLAIVGLVTAASAAPRPGEFSTASDVLGWIYQYRAKPDPAAVPGAVHVLSRVGAFRDPDHAGVYVGFIAGIIGAHPEQAERLVGKMLPLPEEDQWALVRAIAYSRLPGWKDLLRDVAPRLPARRVMIDRYLADKLPTLAQLAITAERRPLLTRVKVSLGLDDMFGGKPAKPVTLAPSPDVIDALWGEYFANGRYRPIAPLVKMLAWSKDRDSTDKLTLGSIAKYTLASNAARDSALLAMLEQVRPHEPKEIAPVLGEVIEAAETVELGRIRSEALASIDEIKRKGPNSRREVSWWGRLGEGALSIGCIAAAATGQVEFGLPCVVGGATTSAALHFWESQ